MANRIRVNVNNENATCKWNAFNSGVTSFPASASEFRGKWNALKDCLLAGYLKGSRITLVSAGYVSIYLPAGFKVFPLI